MSRTTPSKPTFAIPREHLRDHGDPERIERGWSRLEAQLPLITGGRRGRTRHADRWLWLSAAAVLGFVLGVGADRWLAPDSSAPTARRAALTPADDQGPQQVFAAGETRRRYPLPGGGFLSLAPGTIVDTVTRDGRGLTLRLVRGEASMSTQTDAGQGRSTPLSMMVGDAQVYTSSGNVRVRKSGETAELEVLHGSARIASPDLDLG
ncbi:MAG: FecR domain-containing protein, partial [Deltaproteobacteria bacterium]|nr:FecR domain-containing protein [Deltaproteobacteria bacterium]MBW2532260.1 FecR domain-containing protein [Deltaproteobacteria bacterium]